MTKQEKEILNSKTDEELIHTWKIILGRLKKSKGEEKIYLEKLKKYIEKLRK
jgi:hypothetical protein